MKKMNFIAVILVALISCLSAGMVLAEEVFLCVGYQDSGRVFRVATTDEFNLPVGYIFECEAAADFFVDSLKNFRFLQDHATENFTAVTGYIYRQVFDGLAVDADYGAGHAQYQDQRNLVSEDQLARPVFRPLGAPFSAGTGRLVTESIALSTMLANECLPISGKNWYQIPNNSWYQSWVKVADAARPSYTVFFDSLEERKISCVESIWRGYNPGKALERVAGNFTEKRLRRARVDGAMELINDDRAVKDVAKSAGRLAFHVPSVLPGEGDLFFYTWKGRNTGDIKVNGKESSAKIVVESRSPERFAGVSKGVGNDARVYVIGADIIQDWLQKCHLFSDNADCSQAAFYYNSQLNKLTVFAFSSNHDCLYRFEIDEAQSGKVANCTKIDIPFKPQSMKCSASGNLYLTALEVVPADFSDQESLIKGFEALHINHDPERPVAQSEEDISAQLDLIHDHEGHLIFARTHFANTYVLWNGQDKMAKAGEVFLDKDYVACDFILKNVSNREMNGGIAQILKLTEKPGNSLSELKGNVAGFPDQYRRPERLLAAVVDNLQLD